jgi:trigger factor
MELTVKPTGTWQHTLAIEIPADEVEQRMTEVARRIQSRAALPGFRKGKAPLDMVRQNFAPTIEQEFLETFLPRVTNEAIAESKLVPVVPPLVREVEFVPGQPLRFEAVVDVRPEVEAKDVKGLPARRSVRTIDDAAVERVLTGLREESAIFVDVDGPAERGHVVLFDSVRLDVNGRRLPSTRLKARRLELGAEGLAPEIENGLLGALAGQERMVDMTYPADHPSADVAGKTVRYALSVKKIQAKKLREMDDNFAREVFQLATMEELRARVRQNIEGEERVRQQRESEASLTEELVRRNPFDLPERLIEWMLDRVITEATEGRSVQDGLRRELEQHYRPGVERSLRREFLLGAIARQQSLTVSDEEVAAEITRMTQADPRQAARVRARYQTAERREGLRESLVERKAMEWLLSQADVQDAPAAEGSALVSPASR